MTLLVEADHEFAATLSFALGEDVRRVDAPAAVHRDLDAHPDEVLVVVGPDVDLHHALDLASTWQIDRPHLGMVLLRRRVDVQVLGQALRAGVREVVGPEDLGAVVAAARRSIDISRRRRVAHRGGDEENAGTGDGRVVTVFSAKGGCGKTTVATNLAAALAGDGFRVALVDLDLDFGDVAIAMQLVPEHTIMDLLPLAGSMDERAVASVLSAADGIDVLLAPTAPGDAGKVAPAMVPELVRVLRQMYDVVIIDTPPAITEHVLAAFDTSDTFVLLATLDVPALKNLKVSLDTLDLLGYPRDSRLLVLNRADSQVGLEVSDVERTIGAPVGVQIPSSGEVPASINRGRLLVREQPDHAVSRSVKALAAQISGVPRPEPVTAGRGGLRALLRRGGVR